MTYKLERQQKKGIMLIILAVIFAFLVGYGFNNYYITSFLLVILAIRIICEICGLGETIR